MNLFYLDKNLQKNAEYHVNSHCIKQILESCQIICTVFHLQGIQAPYKPTHARHPSSLSAQRTRENFEWVISYCSCLADEYTFRYGKIHKSTEVVEWVQKNKHLLSFEKQRLTEFALAMPDEFKTSCPIESYRNYYREAKKHLHCWTKRDKPSWLRKK